MSNSSSISVGSSFQQIASCTASPLPFMFQHSHTPHPPSLPPSPYPPSHAIHPQSTSPFASSPQPCKCSAAISARHLPPLLHHNSCRPAQSYLTHTSCQSLFLNSVVLPLNFTNILLCLLQPINCFLKQFNSIALQEQLQQNTSPFPPFSIINLQKLLLLV